MTATCQTKTVSRHHDEEQHDRQRLLRSLCLRSYRTRTTVDVATVGDASAANVQSDANVLIAQS
jgi:hypothetical protein